MTEFEAIVKGYGLSEKRRLSWEDDWNLEEAAKAFPDDYCKITISKNLLASIYCYLEQHNIWSAADLQSYFIDNHLRLYEKINDNGEIVDAILF